MANWFDFAGLRSTGLGVYVQEFPPIPLPAERVEFLTVPGRSGYLAQNEGDAVYDDVSLSLDCIISDTANLDAIGAWLRGSGSGALVLGNLPDRYYIARCVNQIDLKRVMRGRTHRAFSAVFRCQPYRYRYPPVAAYPLVNGGSITNPGNVEVEPTLVVTGTGDVTLTIGTKTLTITGITVPITIDVALGVAYKTGVSPLVSQTGLISHDGWPFTVPPGISAVSWTGSVTGVTIAPNWRDV